jgi:hypothetical protein
VAEVEHREVQAREVVTIGAGDPFWRQGTIEVAPGALMRLIPPADATDERIAAVQRMVLAAGAAGVKLMPRAAGREIAEGEVEPAVEQGSAPTTGDLREAVARELEAAKGLPDRAAVATRIEEALGAAGL